MSMVSGVVELFLLLFLPVKFLLIWIIVEESENIKYIKNRPWPSNNEAEDLDPSARAT
jgi:hypothetical protein